METAMASQGGNVLLLTAVAVGFIHTLVGPDHYLPFIVIGRARRWGLGRTSALTFACGLGHVLSSVVIGLVGVAVGIELAKIQGWETARGAWASWTMIIFGTVYGGWGVWVGMRRGGHRHTHLHADGMLHGHPHDHGPGHGTVHSHAHGKDGRIPWKGLTPWVLFIIFVLGPCEPMIPLFFASALSGSWHEVALVSAGYSFVTLATMLAIVAVSWYGLAKLDLGPLERWSHALAGGVIAISGLGMAFLGL
jgi:ABC-type nickel/cobalt efflux system permease component RcnA